MYRVPRQDRAKQSLQAIVDAGSPCLAQRGQVIATTHDVTEKAGIGSAYD